MADDTYYSLFAVSEAATQDEIRVAYIRLIRDVHPDRLANAPSYWQRQAEEKTKEINEAYTVLVDPEKRRRYDAELANHRQSQTSASGKSKSQPSAPGSAPQGSKSAAEPQRNSDANQQSGPRSQAASSSAPPPNAPSRSPSHPIAFGLNGGRRFFFALIGSILAYFATGSLWDSASIGAEVFFFLVAAFLLFGVAILYQSDIRPLFDLVGIRRTKSQLWVSMGMIAFVLLMGNIAYKNTHRSSTASQPVSGKSPASSDLNDGSNTKDPQTRSAPNGPGVAQPLSESEPSPNRQGDKPLFDKFGSPAPAPTRHDSNGIASCGDWTLDANREWQYNLHNCDDKPKP